MKRINHIFSRTVLTILLLSVTLVSFFGGAGALSHADVGRIKESELPATSLQWEDSAAVTASAAKEKLLIPGGIAFGVKFHTKGVMVVSLSDVTSAEGRFNPAYEAGIRQSDVIVAVNGNEIGSVARLTELVEASKGQRITVTYMRNGKEYTVKLTPKYSDADGKYKTGLMVRDSGAGIGTVTYIDPRDLSFGGLGHGICDSETGSLMPLDRGSVLGVRINGIQKGVAGAPGEIKGCFTSAKTGTLRTNTQCGVFGVFTECPQGLISEAIPTGNRDQLKEGDAEIICTLDDTGAHRYRVRISEINRSATGNKCFSVTVTDKALIEKTGGIVQGMSGSPIIQNGKLVGAVTHVLINDPTKGYGIFIENMLSNLPEALG